MALQFYLTDAGRQASIDAENLSVDIKITEIAVGDGKYDPQANASSMTALQNEVARYPTNGGGKQNETLRLIASIDSTVTLNAFEIGLCLEDGTLFMVASTTGSNPLLVLVNEITTIVTFGIKLSDIQANIAVDIDANSPIAVTLMNEHLAHENPHPQYALISALNTLLEQYALDVDVTQAIDYLTNLLQIHKQATNPHPQYLLASTFGVHLPMAANVNTTPIDDLHNVLGWNGENGTFVTVSGTVDWGKSKSGTQSFKPFRAYGQFMLVLDVTTADEYRATIKIYNKNNVLVQTLNNAIYYRGGAKTSTEKYVFVLGEGGYAEIEWYVRAGYKKKADMSLSIYVDDRVKRFSPVGYTSVVDGSNINNSSGVETEDGYEIYPEYEWFYYSDAEANYIQLSSTSTLENSVENIPSYHRDKFSSNIDDELWVLIEVGTQTVETPENDYSAAQVEVLRATVDENGDIVIGIPFNMRTVNAPNNETLVYTVGYYTSEVSKELSEDFPSGALLGLNKIYVGTI